VVDVDRQRPVELLPLFRSRVQLVVLTELLLRGAGRTVSDLARLAGVSRPSALAEVERLERTGIVRSRREGRNRVVQAAVTGPVRHALETLVLYAAGPLVVVAEELAGVPGVEGAVLHGSWAERYLGVPGRPPNDIDVVVIGRPDRDDVFDAAERARERLALGLDVNATVVSPAAWEQASTPFLQQVRARPLVPLHLGEAGR
jgi:DNA-binding transcriptional ArsR family regulator